MWRSALLVVVGVVLFALAHVGRQWNFDCVGYAVAAERWRGADEREAHTRVYAALAATAPAPELKAITEASEYRRGLFSDPSQLASQVGFYANKPLLVAFAALLASLGANVIDAIFWVSALAFALFGVLFVHGCLIRLPRWGALGALALVTPPLLETGQLATPDSLAALFLLAGARLLLETNKRGAAIAMFAVACLARPDSLLLSIPLLVWHGTAHGQWRTILGSAAGLVALTQFTGAIVGAHSWRALFVHTFLRRLTSSAVLAEAHVQLGDYASIAWRGFKNDFVMHPSMWPLFVTLGALACVRPAARGPLLAVGLGAVAHFLLFPMLADRFFLAQEALVGLALIEAVAAKPQSRSPEITAPG